MGSYQSTQKVKKAQAGFTLVELSFAIAFFSILLIIIAALISHTIASYQKGLTVKAVNSVGKTITDDLSSAISSAPIQDLSQFCSGYFKEDLQLQSCINQHGLPFMFAEGLDDSDSKQAYGAFCTGEYVYFWNTGYAGENQQIALTYTDKYNKLKEDSSDFRLLKFQSSSHTFCADIASSKTTSSKTTYFDLTSSPAPKELIASSEQQLILYDFTIFPSSIDQATKAVFYSGTFILGSRTGNINVTSNGDYCQNTNSSSLSDFSYCALNKFNFAAMTAGSV